MRPFRLGATSYMFPADLGTNARQLAGVVDDMEIEKLVKENQGLDDTGSVWRTGFFLVT